MPSNPQPLSSIDGSRVGSSASIEPRCWTRCTVEGETPDSGGVAGFVREYMATSSIRSAGGNRHGRPHPHPWPARSCVLSSSPN